MSIISLYQAWNLAWGSESWTHLGTFYLPITDRHCCVIPVRISTGKWLLHLWYFAVIISPSRRTPSTFKCSAFIHISFSIQGHITTHAAQSAPLNNLLIDRESLTNTTSGSRGASTAVRLNYCSDSQGVGYVTACINLQEFVETAPSAHRLVASCSYLSDGRFRLITV